MASSSPFSFLFLTALLATLFVSVPADEQLVQTTCHKTVDYDVCYRCIKMFLDYKKADAPGLASLMTHCGSSYVHILAQTFLDLTRNQSEAPEVRRVYADCKDRYDKAAADFAVCRQYLEGKEKAYARAKASVAGVLLVAQTCKNKLRVVGHLAPFEEDMEKVTVVCQVTANIIDQI